MIQLHHAPSSAAMAPFILLEELGERFELVAVDTGSGAHRQPAYLKLNPNGLIPTLVDGELVLYETAAILLHLADTHPDAGLLPALGTAERAQAYKWMLWLSNTLQAALIAWFYPERWSASRPEEVREQVEQRIAGLLQQLDDELGRHGGPWLLGERYSALDALCFTLCRWTRRFARPARDYPRLGPYLQRMLARPAVQRVFEREALQPPLI